MTALVETVVPCGGGSLYRGRKQAVVKTPSFLQATFAGQTLFGGTAEIISNGIRSNRTCTIQISNHTGVPLTNPEFYCYDGGLYYPLPNVIQPGTREACVFSKDPSLPHGVIGLLTFLVGEYRMAVMFSVAYNQLQYRNHFGMAVTPEDKNDISTLFDQMYTEAEFYDRAGRAHGLANDGVPMWVCDGMYQIRGSMSDRGKAIIKLNVAPV